MKRLLFVLLPLLFFEVSCKKFLDKNPNDNDQVVETLDDLQKMLDNTEMMNVKGVGCYSEMAADNYYITKTDYESYGASINRYVQSEITNYTWDSNAVPSDYYWEFAFQHSIFEANNVIDLLDKIKLTESEAEKAGHIRGSALFYRAFTYLGLAQLFCRPYHNSYLNEWGIVLRLSASVSNSPNRYTVRHTYETIISDLTKAIGLLPEETEYPTQPSKAAAYAALARTYLSMGKYDEAGDYADSALQVKPGLIDYNSQPITRFHPEVIFHSISPPFVIMGAEVHKIDSNLYDSYHENDLRKTIYFGQNINDPGTYHFRGSYIGEEPYYTVFDGLATDEMYLIRAECAAQDDRIDDALADLNTLMEKRWKAGSFTPFKAVTKPEALKIILDERRKELVWRGLRWSDIRRFNANGDKITLQRKIGEKPFYLFPNDFETVMLIPQSEIDLGGIPQNPRR